MAHHLAHRGPVLLTTLAAVALLACPRPTVGTEASEAGTELSPAKDPGPADQPGAQTTGPSSAPEVTTDAQAPDSAPGAAAGSGEVELQADRERSQVGFAIARATVGHIGHFADFEARLTLVDEQPTALEIAVQTGSVVADRAGLTRHLKGADFFEVDKFPTATFTADSFTPAEAREGEFQIAGTMRLHGVQRKLKFPATIEIAADHVVGRATLDISAAAFAIDYEGMEAELAEDAVQLEIELVFPRVAGD